MNGHESAPDGFRVLLREHDRRVLAVSLLTAIGAFGAWCALYFVCYWVALLVSTVISGEAATPPTDLLDTFLIVALALCVVAWTFTSGRRDLPPPDRIPGWRQVIDVLMGLPRLTVSVLGTLGARAKLGERDTDLAWFMLSRVLEEKGMPAATFAALLPDRRKARHLGLVLQMAGLLEMERTGEGFFLRPTSRAGHLVTDGHTVRFHPPTR